MIYCRLPHRQRFLIPALIPVLALVVASCSSTEAPAKPGDVARTAATSAPATATPIPPTATPAPTATPVPPTATPLPTATPPPTATPTPEPTATPSPTATPAPPALKVSADILNIRSGPSTAYPVLGRLNRDESVKVAGKSEDGKWWQIEVEEGKGWVSSDLVTTSGPVEGLAVVKVAPPPTAVPQPAVAAAAAGAPRPVNACMFGYGIQIDPWADRGAAISRLKEMGFRWVKFQLAWKEFEGTRGERNFPEDVINDLHNNGRQILVSIVKAPNWARNPAYGFQEEGPPQNPGDYAAYVGAFAGRYCGKVQAIEVWNEQNLAREWGHEPLDAGRYVQLLATAYNAIKGACGSMIVISGAPTPTGANPPAAIRDTTYLRQMYQAGLARWSDAIGVHPSGYGNPPDIRVRDLQAGTYSRPSHVNDSSFYFRDTMEQYWTIMREFGDGGTCLWPTEFGWASTGSPVQNYEYAVYNSEQAQGEYIAWAFDTMRSWGFVGPAFLWNLNYNKSQPGSEMAAFGIMDRPAQEILKGRLR